MKRLLNTLYITSDTGVDHGLTLHNILIVFRRDVDVSEHRQVGLPTEFGTGLVVLRCFLVETADVLALFKFAFGDGAVRKANAVPPQYRQNPTWRILSELGRCADC